jgi:hypothetical protein
MRKTIKSEPAAESCPAESMSVTWSCDMRDPSEYGAGERRVQDTDYADA